MLFMNPIHSAPKNGRHVLLRGPSGYTSSKHRFDEGYFDASKSEGAQWRDHRGDAWSEGGEPPDHWAELTLVNLQTPGDMIR